MIAGWRAEARGGEGAVDRTPRTYAAVTVAVWMLRFDTRRPENPVLISHSKD